MAAKAATYALLSRQHPATGKFPQKSCHTNAILLTNFSGLIASCLKGALAMEFSEYTTKLDELDHLLNDPDVSLEPDRVWMLLAELSRHDLASSPSPATAGP
jgi:hypothetical protein